MSLIDRLDAIAEALTDLEAGFAAYAYADNLVSELENDVAAIDSAQSVPVDLDSKVAELRARVDALKTGTPTPTPDPTPDPVERIVGANVNGTHGFWRGDPSSDAAIAGYLRWGWNTVRLCCGLPNGPNYWTKQYPDVWANGDLDTHIARLTAAGIRVIVAQFASGPGSWPDTALEQRITDWCVDVARRHAGNPLVWINPLNEPGAPSHPLARWRDTHHRIVSAIRQVADNTIVLDGTHWGQDVGFWNNAQPTATTSALLAYGVEFAALGCVGAVHVYDQWGWPESDHQGRVVRIGRYLDEVAATGLPLIVGETGSYADKRTVDDAASRATKSLYVALADRPEVGVLAWHATPGDGFALVEGPNGAFTAAAADWSNLSWHGELLHGLI